jgi:hypothetical protein
MMNEYQQGAQASKDGHSIHYNPYRHRGTPEQFIDWQNGWLSVVN